VEVLEENLDLLHLEVVESRLIHVLFVMELGKCGATFVAGPDNLGLMEVGRT
jgi:hypothetical protein